MKHYPFVTLLIVIAIAVLIDLYTYQGVRALTQKWTSKRKRQVMLRAYLVFNIGLLITLCIGFLAMDKSRAPSIGLMRLLGFFFAMLVPKLIFCILLILEDTYRLLKGIFHYLYHRISPPHNPEGVIYFPGRRRFVSQIALGLASIPFLAIIEGMVKGKYDYRVHRETIFFPDLPEAFDGFTITQVSDIHSGSFDSMEGVMRGVNMVNAQKSDLFVFTGDLVNTVSTEIIPWLDIFKTFRAPYGQYSILGNHDYGKYGRFDKDEVKNEELRLADHEKLKKHHETLGYNLMLNEHTVIEKDGQKISLLGVENWGLGFETRGDLQKTLQGVDPNSFKILLSHDPSHWDAQVKQDKQHIHLTLSGHTHGMQFGIEIPGFKWSPIQMRYPKWAGLYQEGGKYLYVNRGFGFLGFPGRVGIWPEVTVLTLKRSV
jgi:predicted MPP superfamily phosphohydrolase